MTKLRQIEVGLRRLFYAALMVPLLAACTSSRQEIPRIETSFSVTPEFNEILGSPDNPQSLIEQELDAAEVVQFQAFLRSLPIENQNAFLRVFAGMDDGVRGLIVASYILSNPKAGRNFSILAFELGSEYQPGLGRELSTESASRWESIEAGLKERIIDESTYDIEDMVFALWPITYPDRPSPSAYGRIADLLPDGSWYVTSLMINADMAEPGAAPWQVQLARFGKDRAYYQHPKRIRGEIQRYGRTRKAWERDHVCGAVYIGGEFALTAAHCVQGWAGYDSEFFEGRRIRAGTQDIAFDGQIISIDAVVMHAKYEEGKSYKGYDIALLKLTEKPRAPAAQRARIPLHPRNGQKPGTELVQTGWGLTGATHNTKRASDISGRFQRSAQFLRIGKLELYESSECDTNSAFIKRDVKLGFGQICVGSDEGVDACKGDSGGPLVRMTGDKPPILVGLVSWGIGCGIENRPAIYTDVGAFYSWIKKAQNRAKTGKITRLK
jgi:secreted trypsin-like serine protease